MMKYWRKKYIREGASMTLNSTYKLDLPETGYLGALFISLSGTQVSGYGQGGGDWRIIDKISKIEIIANGATVIKSLTGKQFQALAWLDNHVTAPDQWRNYASAVQYCMIPVYFGREMLDREMFLNSRDFSSLELQITNTGAAATFADLTVSVLAYYLEPEAQISPPLGFLRTEEWRKYTTAQNATQYFDLPTELKMRRILLQMYPAVDANFLATTGMWNLADDLGLYLRTGGVELFRGGVDDLIRQSQYEYQKEVITSGRPYISADKGFDMGIGYVNGVSASAGTASGAVATVIPTVEGGRTDFTQKAEAYTADQPIEMIAKGECYHNTLVVFDAHDPSPENWLDPKVDETVQLNIHTRDSSSAASGTISVILDRLVQSA